MPLIEVAHLCRDFEYYEKETGFTGSLRNLFHREKQIRHAVNDISFAVEAGEIVGFIGPNGAGKTTVLKMLSGILYPSSGKALVNGYIPWERKEGFKHLFALVAGQKSQLWVDLPASESLYLNKCIYEIPDDEYKRTVDELTEMLDVKDFLKVQVRRLSLGERMKFELIAALLHKPQVVFLDEPTIGLDIISQQSIRNYLIEYNRKTNATIILTSHYMKDIEAVCDHTIVISHGEKVFDGNYDGLKKYNSGSKRINLICSSIQDEALFRKYSDAVKVRKNEVSLEVKRENVNAYITEILALFSVEDLSIEDPPIENSIEMIYSERSLRG